MMLAFSFVPTIQIRLPAGTNNQSLVHLVGFVQDTMDSVTAFNLSSVIVVSDIAEIANLVTSLQNLQTAMTTNPLVQRLASGNQNAVCQVISSLSQAFNQINDQTVSTAVASELLNDHVLFYVLIFVFRWYSCIIDCCIILK